MLTKLPGYSLFWHSKPSYISGFACSRNQACRLFPYKKIQDIREHAGITILIFIPQDQPFSIY
ncbi:hypothetical protein GWK_05090 [Chlamydia psittaci CP3]|nr:hypothetical protein GWK_05090 [Chlamydia psittaci CP3]